MEFSDYIQRLYYCAGRGTKAEFVREVLTEAAGGGTDSAFSSLTADAYRKLYSGRNSMARQAPAVMARMDTARFVDYLQDRLDSAPGSFLRVDESFGDSIPDGQTYASFLAEEFYRSLVEAASRTRARKAARKEKAGPAEG